MPLVAEEEGFRPIFLPVKCLPLPLPHVRTILGTISGANTTRGRNDCKKALCAATKYMIGVVVIVALIAGILFTLLGQSDVPVKDFEVRATRTSTSGGLIPVMI